MADDLPATPRRRGLGLVGLAAAGGAVAGLAAVYVIGGFGGNAGGAAAAGCEGAAATAAALKPFATGEVAAFLPASSPVSVADLSFTGPDGAPMRLADKAGKTVLLNLWATWCAPCREEMPALDRLQAALGGDGFEVVAVNVDTRDDGRDGRFLQEEGIASLARYSDRSMGVFNTLKGRALAVGMPTTLLVDGAGCELGVMHGPAEWDSKDAEALIEAARRAPAS